MDGDSAYSRVEGTTGASRYRSGGPPYDADHPPPPPPGSPPRFSYRHRGRRASREWAPNDSDHTGPPRLGNPNQAWPSENESPIRATARRSPSSEPTHPAPFSQGSPSWRQGSDNGPQGRATEGAFTYGQNDHNIDPRVNQSHRGRPFLGAEYDNAFQYKDSPRFNDNQSYNADVSRPNDGYSTYNRDPQQYHGPQDGTSMRDPFIEWKSFTRTLPDDDTQYQRPEFDIPRNRSSNARERSPVYCDENYKPDRGYREREYKYEDRREPLRYGKPSATPIDTYDYQHFGDSVHGNQRDQERYKYHGEEGSWGRRDSHREGERGDHGRGEYQYHGRPLDTFQNQDHNDSNQDHNDSNQGRNERSTPFYKSPPNEPSHQYRERSPMRDAHRQESHCSYEEHDIALSYDQPHNRLNVEGLGVASWSSRDRKGNTGTAYTREDHHNEAETNMGRPENPTATPNMRTALAPTIPSTAYNLTFYTRSLATLYPFATGRDGKVPPSTYGSTPMHDLGLCRTTFLTAGACSLGENCPWRHHPTTRAEEQWFVRAVGEGGARAFMETAQHFWSRPEPPLPGANMATVEKFTTSRGGEEMGSVKPKPKRLEDRITRG